jgi:phosphoserine phosphatase
VGRVVRPLQQHAARLEEILGDPAFAHVYFDISWDEVAKYVVATPEATKITADLMTRYPDRFLFGTDEVAPTNESDYLRVFKQYGPLWKALPAEVSEKVRRKNYERIFDGARRRVRAWESAHAASSERSVNSH